MSWAPETGTIQLQGLHHVGVVVRDVRATTQMLSAVWNLGEPIVVDFSPGADDLTVGDPFSLTLAFVALGPVTIEMIEPSHDGSIWANFLADRGEGMHHFAYDVSNFDEITDVFLDKGHRPLVAGLFEGKRWNYFELNPGGMVVELRDA